jgi:hypothetical protein
LEDFYCTTARRPADFRLQEKKQWLAVAKLLPFLLRLKPEAFLLKPEV